MAKVPFVPGTLDEVRRELVGSHGNRPNPQLGKRGPRYLRRGEPLDEVQGGPQHCPGLGARRVVSA